MNINSEKDRHFNGKRRVRAALRAVAVCLMLICTAACASCGKGEFSVNVDEAVSYILENGGFESEMQEIDADSLSILYTITEGTQVKAYVAGGSLADELVVFTAADKAGADQMLANVKDHIDERKDLFADYAPDEVTKLSKACVKQRGQYVVVCVSGDSDKALEAIEKYF